MHDVQLLLSLAPFWKVTFTYREDNCVAHVLAKYACNMGDDQIWVDEVPHVISDVLKRINRL